MKKLFPLLVFFGSILSYGNLSAQQHPQDTTIRYSINNCVVPFTKSEITPTKSGYAFWYLPKEFTQSGFNVKLSYVDKATATHAPHQHPNDECYFILEGRATVIIGNKEMRVRPGTCVYCPGGVLHGIKKAGRKSIKYLVINNAL